MHNTYSNNTLSRISVIIKFLVYEFSAIETLRDGKDPTEQENQELWEMLIENGRLYLGKILLEYISH